MRVQFLLTLVLVFAFASAAVHGGDSPALAEDAEKLRQQIVELNKELFLLEEDLLHPASTRTAVYLSIDQGVLFSLDSVKLKLDGKTVHSHLYTENEINALRRGAIQPLFITDLAAGQHNLTAIFIGKGPKGREFKRAVTIDFDKGSEAKAFEIKIQDDPSRQQPKFEVVTWQ